MTNYKKPTKLVPLNFYSPYQTFRENRRLISRDKISLHKKFYGESESQREGSVPLMNTCVRSFTWMYRSPARRVTSFHVEQSLGKDRNPKTRQLSKTSELPRQETIKQFLVRKPTISIHKMQELDLKSTNLTDTISKGSLIFTSAMIFKEKDFLMIPISDLKEFLFVPEGELIYNISLSMKNFSWTLGKGLYSNYSEVPYDYKSPFYLPNMQMSVFLVKAKAVYARQLGKIVTSLESKGLTMKLFRYLNGSTPDILMAWEGCEAKAVTQKISESFKADFFHFLPPDEECKYLEPEDLKLLDDYLIPSLTFHTQNQYYKFIYPKVTFSGTNESYPVPLGALKLMLENSFTGWAEAWAKRFEYRFPPRRAGQETSTLKASINLKDQPCVLTLNSYEITISNEELEASFAFKISDLEYIFKHLGPDLVPSLTSQAKLIRKEARNRILWDLSIEIRNQLPITKGEVPTSYSVKIDNKNFKCKFALPWAELYKPHTGESLTYALSNKDVMKIIEKNFNDWDELILKHFT